MGEPYASRAKQSPETNGPQFSSEQIVKMQRDISLIQTAGALLHTRGGRAVVIGGYASDAQQGKITRYHQDVDLQLYLPSGDNTGRKELLGSLFPAHEAWIATNFNGTHEVIVRNPQTNQRVDIHFYSLIQPATEGDRELVINKPFSNIPEKTPIEAATFFDLEGTRQTVLTGTIEHMVARRIFAVLFHPHDLSRRAIKPSDYGDIFPLLLSSTFKQAEYERQMAQILEQREKLDRVSAIASARRYLQQFIEECSQEA